MPVESTARFLVLPLHVVLAGNAQLISCPFEVSSLFTWSRPVAVDQTKLVDGCGAAVP
jgi:hypothetical protein